MAPEVGARAAARGLRRCTPLRRLDCAGLRGDSDLINAALAVIAAGDDFGAWLVGQAGRLPEDFELAL